MQCSAVVVIHVSVCRLLRGQTRYITVNIMVQHSVVVRIAVRIAILCNANAMFSLNIPLGRGATTFSKLGVQFLGLGYYYPSSLPSLMQSVA